MIGSLAEMFHFFVSSVYLVGVFLSFDLHSVVVQRSSQISDFVGLVSDELVRFWYEDELFVGRDISRTPSGNFFLGLKDEPI